jgi:hypothetical protein
LYDGMLLKVSCLTNIAAVVAESHVVDAQISVSVNLSVCKLILQKDNSEI